jgi:hypothetical protein
MFQVIYFIIKCQFDSQTTQKSNRLMSVTTFIVSLVHLESGDPGAITESLKSTIKIE